MKARTAGLVALAAAAAAIAENVVELEWNITYTTANPDGMFERQVIGVNGAWPPPAVNLTEGDRVIIKTNNHLTEGTSLHAHGMFQNTTTYMDGPVGVTQCAIPPNGSFTYNFTVDQVGTYWIHSHAKGQYPDGLRSPFVIHAKNETHGASYDEDVTVPLSDWYHTRIMDLNERFMSLANPSGAEPVPKSALMFDTQNATLSFEAGKTYRLRFVNMAAFAAFHVWIEGHTMRVIEVDGVDTEEYETDGISLTAAQRVSVLVTARNDTSGAFPIVGAMDTDMFDTVPGDLNPNVTSYIIYDSASSLDLPTPATVDAFPPFDDTQLVPSVPIQPYSGDHNITLDVLFDVLGDGSNYAMFNTQTYLTPDTPPLFTAMSTGVNATDPVLYGSATNSFVVPHLVGVEMVINNYDPGKHPFHLHGHTFQVLGRSVEDAGPYDPSNVTFDIPANPMRRDVVQVPPNGHVLLRFFSDNPGVWLFHCHIEWHILSGLIAQIIEAPLVMQERVSIPSFISDECAAQSIPTSGNALGNTGALLYDFHGYNAGPGFLPTGFTAKGYVGMVMSVLSAFLGMGVICWYGITEVKEAAEEAKEREGEGEEKVGGVAVVREL
ncbi:hypothetical protein G7K_5273-t1 [Saitoella complicata NRRL Y-17804]|uniref:Ferroxidase n=1 Tax=Saitoella complicata (strain BCRC 22490 / CBS 7301 / JCM 7358 / NBRC 10748 / NRRL Y-17804) TaxID=698492 RepID=A0A0E9NMQ6_SAICN|nr:hypothetical protein G7K_5273-t1 [Saitoella complicata NRRL Y-17804]